MAPEKSPGLVLPLTVVTVGDVTHLEWDLSAADDFLVQAAVRSAGQKISLPRLTRQLEAVAKINNCNLLKMEDRDRLGRMLKQLQQRAPVVHISFATDPPMAFMHKLVKWFRTNIHPDVLLQVGLQPGIAAGCTLRTTNLYFDFSLRKHLFHNRKILLDKIRENSRAHE